MTWEISVCAATEFVEGNVSNSSRYESSLTGIQSCSVQNHCRNLRFGNAADSSLGNKRASR